MVAAPDFLAELSDSARCRTACCVVDPRFTDVDAMPQCSSTRVATTSKACLARTELVMTYRSFFFPKETVPGESYGKQEVVSLRHRRKEKGVHLLQKLHVTNKSLSR